MTDIVTKQQIWKDMFGNVLEKGAELAQTYDMPLSMSPSKSKQKPAGDKAVISKVASAIRGVHAEWVTTDDDMLKEAFGIGVGRGVGSPEHQKKWGTRVSVGIPYGVGVTVAPHKKMQQYGVGVGVGGLGPMVSVNVGQLRRGLAERKNVEQLPQAKSLSPHVDVSSKEPPSPSKEKKASRYACPTHGMYPLDGYDQVVKAASYFDEFGVRMEPEMRREYCHNLVKRASELGIKVSSVAARYGADTYASPEQIKIALDGRRALLEERDVAVLDKLAEAQPTMHPELFAETLHEFDRRNFLDQYYGDIPDPYFSTFDKTAADDVVTESDASPTDAIIIGNEYLPMEKLLEFSKRGYDAMWNRFGLDVAKAFSDDPKAIFESLPRDQKLVVMRLANSNDSQLRGSTTS